MSNPLALNDKIIIMDSVISMLFFLMIIFALYILYMIYRLVRFTDKILLLSISSVILALLFGLTFWILSLA